MFFGVDEILTLFFILLSFWLLSRTRNLSNIFDPVVYFFLIHVVFFSVGLFYFKSVWELQILEFSFFAPTLLLMQFSTIVFFIDKVSGVRKKNSVALRVELIHAGRMYSQLMLDVSFFYLCIGLLLSVSYFSLTIGLDGFFSNDLDNIRTEGRKGYGWLALLAIAFVTVPSIYIVHVCLANKWYFVGTGAALLAFFFLLLIGNRGPSFEILIIFIFLFFLMKDGQVKLRYGLLILVAVALLLGLLSVLRQGGIVGIDIVLLKAVWRPYVNIDNLNKVVVFYSNVAPLMGGGYLMDLSVLAPGYQPNFGMWFKDAAGLVFSGGGVTVTYAGEIIANFGRYSLFVVSPLYFGLIYFLSIYTRSHGETAWSFTLVVIISLSLKAMVSSGLVSPILYIFIPFFFVYSLMMVTRIIFANSVR